MCFCIVDPRWMVRSSTKSPLIVAPHVLLLYYINVICKMEWINWNYLGGTRVQQCGLFSCSLKNLFSTLYLSGNLRLYIISKLVYEQFINHCNLMMGWLRDYDYWCRVDCIIVLSIRCSLTNLTKYWILSNLLAILGPKSIPCC